MADQPFDMFYLPFRPALDANGIVVPGASLTFYTTGTSTLQTVYADAALTVPLDNPVTANSAGVWPSIYIDNSLTYRVVLRNELGAVLNEVDPYAPGAVGGPPGPQGEGLAEVMAPGGSALVGFQPIAAAGAFRPTQDKLRDVISVRDYGAIGDGTLHTVAEWIIPGALGRYASLSALQVDYPHVTVTTDSIDWAAGQKAYNYGKSLVIAQETTGGYGALQKGGVTVYWPRGVYITNSKPLEFAMNVSTEGDGPQSSLIKSTFDGQIFRNDPVPLGPGGYNREGSNLRNFGIIGDPTKPNQIGLSLLRWISSEMNAVAISSCGGDAWLMRECSCNQISNCRISLNEGKGLRMRVGLIGTWGTTENELPCNGNEFHNCRWIENGSTGISLETGVNGAIFSGCYVEYNDGRGTGNTGKQIVITAGSYVPIVFHELWAEGSKLAAHVSVENTNAQVIIDKWRHFPHDALVDRALIVSGGVVDVLDPRSTTNSYPTINGSNAPYRVNKAAAVLYVVNHSGNNLGGIDLVEKMDGSKVGLFGALSQTGRSAFYGQFKFYSDSGSAESLGFYRDDNPSSAWANFDAFRQSLSFVDTGLKRSGQRTLSLQAVDGSGGGSFLDQGSIWNGSHTLMGAYHLWVDATGKLRIKNGAPTSDTDGATVGSQ